MLSLAATPGRTLHAEGREYLYFGGTAYLGLPTLPEFQDLLIQNIRRWGTAYGSSRNANVQLTAYPDAENHLSELVGLAATVTLSSGMLAGKLAIETLEATGTRFFHFPACHPAILAKGSEPFYRDGSLHPDLLNDKKESITLLTDAVPSLQVHPVDLKDITLVSPAKNITLVVDESHSLGILGLNGGGISPELDLPNVWRKILVASLGKAYALTGGLIASDPDFIGLVRESASFVAGAGMNPAFAQTLYDARKLYFRQRQQLLENTALIFQLLKDRGDLEASVEYPVIYPRDENSHRFLLNQGIVITHFQYPTSPKVMNRIVLSAHHTRQDLERLADALTRRVAPDG